MSKKLKTMLICAIALVAVLVITLVGCAPKGDVVVTNSQKVWSEAASKKATDTLQIRDLKVDTLLTLNSVDIITSREINGNDIKMDVKVENISVTPGSKIEKLLETVGNIDAIKNLLGGANLMTVLNSLNHLSVSISLEYKEGGIVGEFHAYNLDKILPAKFETSDSNPENAKFTLTKEQIDNEGEWVGGVVELLKGQLFTDVNVVKSSSGAGSSKMTVTPKFTNVIKVLDALLNKFGTTTVPGSDKTVKDLLSEGLGSSSPSSLLKTYLTFDETVSKVKIKKNLITESNVSGSLKVNVDKDKVGELLKIVGVFVPDIKIIATLLPSLLSSNVDSLITANFSTSSTYSIA